MIEHGLGLRVLRHLQVGVGLIVEGVQRFADAAGLLRLRRRLDVGGHRFLPQADTREGVRGHVERVGHGRRDVRVRARGRQRLVGQRRHVVGVDDVVRQPRVVRHLLVERLENLRGAQVLRERLVGGERGLIDRQRPEDPGLDVARILRGHRFGRLLVRQHPRSLRARVGAREQSGHGVDVALLARRRRSGRLALVDRGLARGNRLGRSQAGERIAPVRQGDPPVGHRAGRDRS